MTIDHQILTDKDGRPTAALIPWDQFEEIRERLADEKGDVLSEEYKAELDRRVEGLRNGTTEGISHEEVMEDLRDTLKKLDQESDQKSA